MNRMRSHWRVEPCLTFAPLAWPKLQFFCHAGATEIGGFGISASRRCLYVEDFVTVRQQVTPVTVRFDDEAVADFLDRSVDRGMRLDQCSRIWCHTHPGASAEPTEVDEATFARAFGRCDWAIMFILSRTGQTYARLAFAAGPGGHIHLPVAVDWSAWPECFAADPGTFGDYFDEWRQEFKDNIHELRPPSVPAKKDAAEAIADDSLDAQELYDLSFDPEWEIRYELAPEPVP